MCNEDELIDKALLYANDKIPFKLTVDIVNKRNNLIGVLPKGNEELINAYGESILKESMELYENAMHYLVTMRNLADSDVLQGIFSIAS